MTSYFGSNRVQSVISISRGRFACRSGTTIRNSVGSDDIGSYQPQPIGGVNGSVGLPNTVIGTKNER